MDQRIYHGELSPNHLANSLIARFNRGNLRAQQIGSGKQVVVQIATRQGALSGGHTAINVNIQEIEGGVSVLVGKQAWLGLAASLGVTALNALRNPFSLVGRLDDLAQDVESLQLSDLVWETIDGAARAAGASFELSERLRRLVCTYCNTANPVGEPACIACGAPLGSLQPGTCRRCGFVIKVGESVCPNCGLRQGV
ncbi:MAG: zinc ribbon domain-containing protein [Anaerolineales bacterium]|jgi:RNA polymerase subunit RPABC4/transcription elongation factor Spt4